jgi:hypothetical protein
LSYNARVVKFYSATNSLARFYDKMIFLCCKNALAYNNAGIVDLNSLFFKEVARGGERTRVLSISFIFSFSPLYR